MARRARRSPGRRGEAETRNEPATRVRREEPGRARGPRRRAQDRRVALRRVPGALRHGARLLDAFGVEYELAPTLVRGLDYYTRTTWEFVGPEEGAQSTISGGGRYDYLVEEIGGPPTPGVGFGAGIERLLLAIGDELEAEAPHVDVFFALDEGAARPVLDLVADFAARDQHRDRLRGPVDQGPADPGRTSRRTDDRRRRRAWSDDPGAGRPGRDDFARRFSARLMP